MEIIEQSYELLTAPEEIARQCKVCELAGRVCYKSEDKITGDSYAPFLRGIIASGHESVIEHSAVTVRFITNRAISHQIVRHRLCSFSQESMRYCNYARSRFNEGVVFIKPFDFEKWAELAQRGWHRHMRDAEDAYITLVAQDIKAEDARGVLPQDVKTEIVVTANFRQWRHILRERAINKHAQPQMRALMAPLLCELNNIAPFLFNDFEG